MARYWMTFFVFSVLPAPDSPLGRGRVGREGERGRGREGERGRGKEGGGDREREGGGEGGRGR